jgi:hypothetical protein
MNRTLQRFVVGLCALWPISVSLAQSERPAVVTGAQMSLSAALETQEYCNGDSEIGFVRVSLKLTFSNKNQAVMLLHRGSGDIARVLVAKTREDMQSGRLEMSLAVTSLTGQAPGELPKPARESLIRLGPGESYETRASVRIPFRILDSVPANLGITTGEHVIAAVVSTWPESYHALARFRQETRQDGQLWSADLRTNHIVVEIPPHPRLHSCNS